MLQSGSPEAHGPELQLPQRKFCSATSSTATAATAVQVQQDPTDPQREAFLTADCCQLPARRLQVLSLPGLVLLVTAGLLMGEIVSADDFVRA